LKFLLRIFNRSYSGVEKESPTALEIFCNVKLVGLDIGLIVAGNVSGCREKEE